MYKITFIYRLANGHKTGLTQATMYWPGETDREAVSRLREELEKAGFVLVTVLMVEKEGYYGYFRSCK